MILDIILKMINKLIEKFMSPEDLILMILLFGLGIITTPLWKKYSNKQVTLENAEDCCPMTGLKKKCESLSVLAKELTQLQDQIAEARVRVGKIMNILSKEYDGQWDRYLYDRELSIREGKKVKDEE